MMGRYRPRVHREIEPWMFHIYHPAHLAAKMKSAERRKKYEEELRYRKKTGIEYSKARRLLGNWADKIKLDEETFYRRLKEYAKEYLETGGRKAHKVSFLSWLRAKDGQLASEAFARDLLAKKTGKKTNIVELIDRLASVPTRAVPSKEAMEDIAEQVRRAPESPVRIWIRFLVVRDPTFREAVGMIPPKERLRRKGARILDVREFSRGTGPTGTERIDVWYLVEVPPDRVMDVVTIGEVYPHYITPGPTTPSLPQPQPKTIPTAPPTPPIPPRPAPQPEPRIKSEDWYVHYPKHPPDMPSIGYKGGTPKTTQPEPQPRYQAPPKSPAVPPTPSVPKPQPKPTEVSPKTTPIPSSEAQEAVVPTSETDHIKVPQWALLLIGAGLLYLLMRR